MLIQSSTQGNKINCHPLHKTIKSMASPPHFLQYLFTKRLEKKHVCGSLYWPQLWCHVYLTYHLTLDASDVSLCMCCTLISWWCEEREETFRTWIHCLRRASMSKGFWGFYLSLPPLHPPRNHLWLNFLPKSSL